MMIVEMSDGKLLKVCDIGGGDGIPADGLDSRCVDALRLDGVWRQFSPQSKYRTTAQVSP